MPKSKRKRAPDQDPNVLGGRDLKKLQKLLKQNADTENESNTIKRRKLYPGQFELSNEINDERNDDLWESVEHKSFDFTDEQKEEWDMFFRNSEEDLDYVQDLKKHLREAQIKVSEEVSQYSGSIPGDLADFKGVDEFEELPEEVINHIRLLSDVLRHYRSGPIPKTMKMLPQLPGCEGLLELLKPLEWTPHVYPRVVKVFASKGNESALHFYENYLLPKVKQDIEENRRLCVQLFEALIASMFRPEEFVSGVFLPWVQSEMSKTEGIILSHLIKKASLRARFAAVALALTLEEEFSIPRSMVIESLLSKRYNMPEIALKRVCEYFLSFDKDCSVYFTTEGRMPLTWFRSWLIFLESYHDSVDPEHRAQMVKLCRRHEHPQITAEIRKILALVPTSC